MYRDDPIVSSSPPRARSNSPDYVTQPTQPIGTRSPFFAVPADTTQPTLPLTPRAHQRYQPPASQLQVPRSSPAADRGSSPPAMSHSHSQSQARRNMMAPPGTAFFPPQAVRKPVVDLTSDDPPVERDPFESDSEYRSNVPLSKVERSSASRVEETPQKKSLDLSAFAYNGTPNAGANQRKRPSAGLATSPATKKQKVGAPQGGPSRAMPVDLTLDEEMTLEDIVDPELRKKVVRLSAIYPGFSVKKRFDALIKMKGHWNDTCDYLAAEDSEDELLKSPQWGVAQSNKDGAAKKSTAQRTLKQPVKNLLDKYSKLPPSQVVPAAISPEVQQPKQKRRLVRGRKNRSPSPEVSPVRPKPQAQKRPQIIDSDEEDINEGIVEISDDDSAHGSDDVEHTFSEASLLGFFNDSSIAEMADLSGHKEEEIRELFQHRPFNSLDTVRKLHVDLNPSQEKAPKKKARKPRITFGQRLVDAAENMWDAYSTIDSVVKKCENLGKPMVAGMAKWGINIFGASTEEGVEVTSLDDNSDASSSRDSGYHTPHSDAGSSDVRKPGRAKLLKQPAIMNKGIELKDYQVVGLNWLNMLWENKISGILADDMGLGKTCQIIAFLSHLKQTSPGGKPTLIVVPGSTLENWCREFERFSETINFTPYYGPQAQRFEHQETILDNIRQGECDVIITTYDLTFRSPDNHFLRKCKPKICIYDEGHVLKNAQTTRYKSLMRIDTEVRILLTGTPLQNSLQELMSILGFLMPEVFYGKDSNVPDMLEILFKHKAKVVETDSHSTLLSAQRIQRARTMLTPFILRRKKAQVLKHLPKKTSRVEYCDLTATQAELYTQQTEKHASILRDRAAGLPVKDHANVMMKLRQAAIHPLLFRHRYTDDKIRKMSKACLKEPFFAASDPATIFEELSLYQDYQCHQLALKWPSCLAKFQLRNNECLDSGKVHTLLKLLEQYKANGDRALVFSQFTSVMDILGWVFDAHALSYMRMDGSTPIAERQSLIDAFAADPSIPVFVISTKSGGAGINLACANKVVIFDSSFNPQDDVQAENRAHRVGQTREVEVVRLVTRGSVEEQILALGESKLALDKLVQGEEEAGNKKTAAAKGNLSSVEEAGMQAVEAMMLEQMGAKGEGDVKQLFKEGLKKAGVNVAE